MEFRVMTIEDYGQLIGLFKSTPGIALREADSKESIAKYLERNKGLSLVVEANNTIIACIMCGHDGRRGSLQHLIVKPEFRKQGIAKILVNKCINNLQKIGIDKTHILVFKTNKTGDQFWSDSGWTLRSDVNMYSFIFSDNPNA